MFCEHVNADEKTGDMIGCFLICIARCYKWLFLSIPGIEYRHTDALFSVFHQWTRVVLCRLLQCRKPRHYQRRMFKIETRRNTMKKRMMDHLRKNLELPWRPGKSKVWVSFCPCERLQSIKTSGPFIMPYLNFFEAVERIYTHVIKRSLGKMLHLPTKLLSRRSCIMFIPFYVISKFHLIYCKNHY